MSKIPTWDVGDVARFEVTFLDKDKVKTDPSSIALLVRKPSGSEVDHTADIVHDGTGLYHANVPLDASGRWAWKWTGTGLVAAVDEGAIFVSPSAF